MLLCTLLTENYGGVPVRDASDLSFLRGDGLPLEARSPAALLTGLIFTIMPTVDFLKTEILKEHFLPWDMLLAKNADSFTTFLSALKIPTPLWWLWGGTVAYLAGACDSASDTSNRMEKTRAWCADSIGVSVSLHHERHRTSRLQPAGAFLRGTDRSDKNYTENGFLTAFVLNLSSLNMGDPDNYSERYLEKAFAQYQPDEASGADFQNPDVIVILSESFWDPTTLKNVSFYRGPDSQLPQDSCGKPRRQHGFLHLRRRHGASRI